MTNLALITEIRVF